MHDVAAVQQNAEALKYVSEELKGDEEFMLAAAHAFDGENLI